MKPDQLCYKTSRDMKRLKELLDQGYEVVCFYTYDWNSPRPNEKPEEYKPIITTDICTAKLMEKGCKYERYVIACRGTGFITYWTKDMPYNYSFLELLEKRDIQFIEPTIIFE